MNYKWGKTGKGAGFTGKRGPEKNQWFCLAIIGFRSLLYSN